MRNIMCAGWRMAVPFLAALLVGWPAGARADVWVTGPSHKVARPEKAPARSEIWDAGQKQMKLFAARNEFVSFQIVFPGPMKDVNVGKFTMTGPGGQKLELVELFREHYLTCKVMSQFDSRHKPADVVQLSDLYDKNSWPHDFPEQLVPLDAKKFGAPFDVDAGTNEVVWVDLFVPEQTPAGVYTGTVQAGGEDLTVKLTVWNFTLPSVSHFPYWVNMQPEEIAWGWGKNHPELKNMHEIWDSFFQMAHNHRVVLEEGWDNDEAYVKSPDRRFYDYVKGTAFTGPFGAGMGQEVFSVGGHSEAYKRFLGLIVKENWLNRAFVYTKDEPQGKSDFDEVRRIGAEVKKATDGRIMRMVTKQYMANVGNLGTLDNDIDIFCGSTPVSHIPEAQKKGKVIWTYNNGMAGGPYIDAPGAACRTHAWAGFLTGARVWFFWRGTYWVDKQCALKPEEKRSIYVSSDPGKYLTDLWNDPMTFDESKKVLKNGKTYPVSSALRLNGDGVLFYPGYAVGVNGAIATVRLKNCRQGATDFEYLYLLEKMGRADAAEAEAKTLLGAASSGAKSADGQQSGGDRFNNYEPNGANWDAARIRLGTVLDGLGEEAIRAKVQPWNQFPNPVGTPEYLDGKRY